MGWSNIKQSLSQFTERIKQELQVYRLVMADARTPWAARILLGAAVGYLLLPFDLIPDAIPILGQLDDLLIVPGLFWLALKLIPDDILAQARQTVQVERIKPDGEKEGNRQ